MTLPNLLNVMSTSVLIRWIHLKRRMELSRCWSCSRCLGYFTGGGQRPHGGGKSSRFGGAPEHGGGESGCDRRGFRAIVSTSGAARGCAPFLTERFTKMAMVTGGLKPTFDEKPVEHLNLQDMRDIRDAVSAFKLSFKNKISL